MKLMTYDEFKTTEDYQQFIKENPDIGYLKVMTFTAYQAIPIENVEILITRDIGNNKVIFFRGTTNSSGIIDNIELPAPVSGYNVKDYQVSNYTVYDLTAIRIDYETIKKYSIGMFGGVKIIQYVKMVPNISKEGE